MFHKILLHDVLRISLKLSKWDLSHFQNKDLHRSINQRIFHVQDLSNFKYIINVKYYILLMLNIYYKCISYNFLKNEKMNVEM